MISVQVIAMTASVLILLFVLELIRRRKLLEQYAILWIFGASALVVLASSRGLLDRLARFLGIAYPPAVLFLAGTLLLVVLAIHFSVIASRVTEQNRKLAQKIALLDAETCHAPRKRAPRTGGREAEGEPRG